MGFWERLISGAEEKSKIRLVFLGEGRDKDRLLKAYREHPQAEIVADEPLPRADEAIRTAGIQAAEIFAKSEQAADLALACFQAGIHASVPAPLATTIEKADELIAAAGVVSGVNVQNDVGGNLAKTRSLILLSKKN